MASESEKPLVAAIQSFEGDPDVASNVARPASLLVALEFVHLERWVSLVGVQQIQRFLTALRSAAEK